MPFVRARAPLAVALAVLTATAHVHAAKASAAVRAKHAATTIRVKALEFRFKLSQSSAPRGTVVFVIRNVGAVQHDFEIDGKVTPLISPGGSARLVVRFAHAGSFPYLCTVPGHADAGMHGVLRIR